MPEKTNIHKKLPHGISATSVLHSFPDAVFFTDTQMRISYFNAEAERITEFKAHEACGMYCKDVLKTGLCETECVIKKALDADRNIFNIETTIKTATGKTVPALVSASLIKDNVDKVVGYLYSFRDVTSLKKIECALRESEGKLEAMLESISDHMSMIDNDLNIIWANNIAKKIFGDDIVGKKCYTAYHRSEKPCEPCPCHTLKAFQDGKVHEDDTEAKDKDGKTIFFHCTSNVALRDSEGNPLAVLDICKDFTERRKLEHQLLQAQKMEAVGQLAGGIAHDFNNILTAIIGYETLIQMELKHNDQLMGYSLEVTKAAQRASDLTHALLAFSRKQIINIRPVNLNGIVKTIKNLLIRIIGEDIELSIKVAKSDLIVMADTTQIEQVLMNLATNARDAMPGGGKLTIHTDLAEIDDQFIEIYGYGKTGNYALICIEDTGHGMDSETKKRIFDPFFTTKEVGKGTGLGLAMVYGIIKQHDGYINVYTKPGKGTTFNIYLPIIQAELEDIKQDEIALIKKGRGETILVVEDDFQVRSFVKKLLKQYGYNIMEAIDGEEAITIFKKSRDDIQLVISDVMMPRKNGKEMYEELRKITPDIKVIFTSGYLPDIIQKKEFSGEIINFISKPILPQELLTKVYETLNTPAM